MFEIWFYYATIASIVFGVLGLSAITFLCVYGVRYILEGHHRKDD